MGRGFPTPRRLFRFPFPSRLGSLGERRKLPQRGPKLNFIQCGCQRSHLVTRIARDHFCDGGPLRWRTFAMAGRHGHNSAADRSNYYEIWQADAK